MVLCIEPTKLYQCYGRKREVFLIFSKYLSSQAAKELEMVLGSISVSRKKDYEVNFASQMFSCVSVLVCTGRSKEKSYRVLEALEGYTLIIPVDSLCIISK